MLRRATIPIKDSRALLKIEHRILNKDVVGPLKVSPDARSMSFRLTRDTDMSSDLTQKVLLLPKRNRWYGLSCPYVALPGSQKYIN